MSLNEATTKKWLIGQQLARAGWDVDNALPVAIELALKYSPERARVMRNRAPSPEYVDYALLDAAGLPLAVVEAKRESRDALAGKRLAKDYARRIRAIHGQMPLIFHERARYLVL